MSRDADKPPASKPGTPGPREIIEQVATDAIGLPVRLVDIENGVANLVAPNHTTLYGKRAIVAALGKARPDLVCVVVLDDEEPKA